MEPALRIAHPGPLRVLLAGRVGHVTGPRSKRLAALESQRRAFDAAHIPLSDVPGFLLAVLDVVEAEAGHAAFQDVAGRIVREKAQRVAALARGHR